MKTATLAAAASLAFGFAGSAHAGVISQADLLGGRTTQTVSVDGTSVTVTAINGKTQHKTVNGVTGIGISGGTVAGEIDWCEALNFEFESPTQITDLSLAFLYNKGEFGDHPAEVARVVTDLGSFTLQVTGPTTATWTGGGSVSNFSIATEAGGGGWTLSGELFDGPVSFLRLESGNPGKKAKYADFSFVSMGTAVPTPGAAALLGLGGLAVARRRRA